jgi:plasmid stability protein
MATLYVRDMPDDLYERLREEARGSRRSIGAMAIELLDSGLAGSDRRLSTAELLRRARAARTRAGGGAGTGSVVDDIRADRDR